MPRPTSARLIWPPAPGFFRMRLVPNGWRVPAQIAVVDGCWQAIIDGDALPPHPDPLIAGCDRIWQAAQEIDQAEYDYLIALKAHALAHAPDHPAANPRKPINRALLRPIMPTQQRTSQ